MRVGAFVVLLVFVAGCAHVDQAAFGTTVALTACDATGTYKAASAGWSDGMQEGNGLLGAKPDPGVVTLYFASVLTAELATWYLVPKKYRGWVLGAAGAIELEAVSYNVGTIGLCGR